MEQEKKLWFKNRYFGWGWRPVTWQGWLVVLLYILTDLGWAEFLAHHAQSNTVDQNNLLIFLAGVAVLTAILIRICYKYGEKPRWHWGFDDDKQ